MAKRDEEAIRRNELRLRGILENSRDWIWEMNLEGWHTYSNHQIEAILGFTREEFQEIDFFGLLHPEDAPGVKERLALLIEGKRGWVSWVVRCRHKDGSYRYLESSASPVLDPRGELIGFQGVDRDITERRNAEERWRRSEKLEAIGQLAGGIAHDFNNLLTVILANSALLKEKLAPLPVEPEVHDRVQEIELAGERATQLTRQLLAFGRRAVVKSQPLDFNGVVENLQRILLRLIGEHIALEVCLAHADLIVDAAVSQMEQLIMNLALNARDAMPSGGRMAITTTAVVLDQEETASIGLSPGPYICLTVADTGKGMDQEIRSRIFEPFFTTKRMGEGTGLGLSTSFGIVRQAGGQIVVESREGEGSTFKVYLPRIEGMPAPAPGESEPGTTHAREVVVLVCEDDEAVRSVMASALSSAGYSVLVAATPDRALELHEQSREPIELVVTDVVMPGMSGLELGRRLARRSPGIKVLLVSGYPQEVLERQGAMEGDFELLEKPFRPQDLLARVQGLISRGRA